MITSVKSVDQNLCSKIFIGVSMKKLLALVAAFAVVGQTSALQNPFAKKNIASAVEIVVSKNKTIVEKTKTFSADALKKAEAFVVANPKAAIAYAVIATLVAEHVSTFVYSSLVESSDATDEDDLDIA